MRVLAADCKNDLSSSRGAQRATPFVRVSVHCVVIRGSVHWCDLGEPAGSAPAKRRPVLVIQADEPKP
ncbi:type II toxin-antitoxin system PemK/MazF family toxin [Arthrobacter bambusae]